MEKIAKAGALTREQLVLSDEISPWKSNVFVAIDKEVSDASMERISGTFLAKTFEGSYNNMSNYVGQMKGFLKSKGKEAKKLLFSYPYCPKCAKAYGKNYIVILAQI